MSELLKPEEGVTVAEYLEGEQLSEVRHELIGGEVYAMSGGSLNHNRISGNIFGALDNQLHGGPCQTFINDVKVIVRTLSDENFYYPNVVVTCDPEDTNDCFLESPSVIFEVLSPSTENRDRKDKYFAYRTLASLQEYVLVSQDKREVTIARRRTGWEPEILSGDDFELRLSCGEAALTSSRIYRGVEFAD